MYILTQKDRISNLIEEHVGSVFDPDAFDAFIAVSNKEKFWTDIMDMSIEGLFDQLNCEDNVEIDLETLAGFVKTLSNIVDLRN